MMDVMKWARSACAIAVCAGSVAWAGPGTLPSPLLPVDSDLDPSFQQLTLDADAAAAVRARDGMILEGFALDGGIRVDLELERTSAFASGALLLHATPNGVEALPAPTHDLYRGAVVGEEGSYVVLSFDDDGVSGIIDMRGETWVISSGPHGAGLDPVVYNISTLPEGLINFRDFICHAGDMPENAELMTAADGAPTTLENVIKCRRTTVAIETDRELLNLFGGDTNAATAYVELLVAANTEIYKRDINLRFEIGYMILYTGSDPWNQGSTGNQLNQLRDYWVANNQSIERDLVHMFSGRGLGGGVAWLDNLCRSYGYAVSANLNGAFPYPLQDRSNQNWDMMVTAHEWGHNMGTPHTHDYEPQIDGCGTNDCSLKDDSTIMSYCHLCPGGLSNIRLGFHPRVIDRMLLTVPSAPCDLVFTDIPTITQQPESLTQVCSGSSVVLSVDALNDEGTADGLTYRWIKDGQFLDIFTRELTLPGVSAADSGLYQVRVGGDCGSAYSQTALVAVSDCNCPADLTGSSDPNDPSYGTRDGDADGDDFFFYLDAFASGNTGVCDLTGSSDPNEPSYDQPDGDCDGDDFFRYLDLFAQGC
ncbi:MAG: M12 family metallo-peptidase [Phycisphaerales bacterium JB037]